MSGMYYNYGWWPGNLIGILVQIMIVVIFVRIIVRMMHKGKGGSWGGPWTGPWKNNSAEELLKERFVKGEIAKEEYEEKLKVIRQDYKH